MRAAVESGELSQERLDTYQQLRQEIADVQQRREEARWRQSEKAAREKQIAKHRRKLKR